LLREDFERIRAAGFNTIRTWNPLTDDELAIAAEFGLWVIQGLWYDTRADFGDPAFQKKTLAEVEKMVVRSSKHPNVLFYLLGNEPHAHTVHKTGLTNVADFYRKLVAIAHRCDPKRPVSYSNCVITDFLVPDMWDLVAHNAYPYSPVTIEKALGYRGYLETIKERFAKDKPLIITEFGLSVSPTGDGRGYGGNTLKQQRDGVVALWDDVLNAGCAGGCVFMWTDGWWKKEDPNVHNDHAEEWYGLLECDTAFAGKPRPVYHALKAYNRAICTQPRDGSVWHGRLPVEVWAPEGAAVRVRVGAEGWVPLTRHGSWWRGELSVTNLPTGLHTVHTEMRDGAAEWCSPKQSTVRIARERDTGPRFRITFRDLPATCEGNLKMPVTIQVRDHQGEPAQSRRVSVARFRHTGWNEFHTTVTTDPEGVAVAHIPVAAHPGIISIAASVEGDVPERSGTGWKQGRGKRYSAYRHITVIR